MKIRFLFASAAAAMGFACSGSGFARTTTPWMPSCAPVTALYFPPGVPPQSTGQNDHAADVCAEGIRVSERDRRADPLEADAGASKSENEVEVSVKDQIQDDQNEQRNAE
ncbi:hypothetical protein [Paraburkholderia sp. DHOC27]|uniref:hypothetical protein n=1 Tax=Paraburkholderia sp. DHOC27 TaxID=2303330 RepID=UPI0011C193A9|nr:hypothetical protein [Paraburkholderia sp. DHOC27]